MKNELDWSGVDMDWNLLAFSISLERQFCIALETLLAYLLAC